MGLGEIKHKIIIISIVSRLASRCIMIPHADFVLTLAIIGMSKLLLYIRTQIKYYKNKLISHILFISIAIIAFFEELLIRFWQA